jgi:hypothetical protein
LITFVNKLGYLVHIESICQNFFLGKIFILYKIIHHSPQGPMLYMVL